MNLYLSFAPEDALFAQLVRAALSGYTLHSGELSQIATADQFFAFITPRYAENLTCSAERRAAQAHDVPITLLVLEGSPVPPELSDAPKRSLDRLWRDFLEKFRTALHLPDPAVAALVSEGRALLGSAPDLAHERLEQALRLAPNDPLPHAALGDYFRSTGAAARARECYQHALALASESPDAHIGLGLLAEAEQAWTRADDHYADALSALGANAAALAELRQFNRPQSGNLYLQAVRTLRHTDLEAARRAAALALEHGVRDGTAYPERIAHRLRAEVLEALGERAAAADAYFEAGKRFLWLNQYAVAAELLRAACRLQPDHTLACWFLANALLGVAALPNYPYVREDILQESERALHDGLAQRLPTAEEAWVYDVRAIQCENRAKLPDEDSEMLRWQAVTYLERGLVLRDDDPYRWQALNRAYRALELERLAIDAARRAAELGDDSALENSIVTLTNAAQYEEVLPLLERFRAKQPSLWAEAVQAYIHVQQDQPTQALPLIAHVIEATERLDAWYLGVRADAFRLMGDYERAADTYRYLWEQRDAPLYAADGALCGWAGYFLGEAAAALPYLAHALSQDTESDAYLYANLGQAYLALADFEQAETAFQHAAERMTNAQQHYQFTRLDLPTTRRLSEAWEHGETARAILDQFEARLNERLAEIAQPQPLIAILEALDFSQDGSWQFIGQQASLARLYAEKGQHQAAALCYQRLLPETERFPEAAGCLSDSVEALLKEADDRFTEGEADAALESYRALAEFLPEDSAFQGELRARIACVRLVQGKPHTAEFNAALKRFKAADVPSVGAALAKACLALAKDVAFVWQLARVGETLPPLATADFNAALLSHLERIFRLPAPSTQTFPLVVPIILELSPTLLNADESPPPILLERYLPEMRARIAETSGVQVPGVRLRANSDLPEDAYLIMLEEMPIVVDLLPAGALFCEESSDTLRVAGIGTVREALHPLSRVRGAWISTSDASRARMLRFNLLDDPLRYMIDHLEAVLRHNLNQFFGWQEMANLLETWQISPEQLAALDHSLLLRVLRALIREGVPLRRQVIAAVQGADFDAALRAARLSLREHLPLGLPRFTLPPETEALIRQYVVQDAYSYLVMPPSAVQDVLAALRALLPPETQRAALIVADPQVRAVMPLITLYEFPYLAVLSQEELADDRNLAAASA